MYVTPVELSTPCAIGQQGATMGTHKDALFAGQTQSLALGPYFVKVFITIRTLRQAIFRGFYNPNHAHGFPPIQTTRPSVVAFSKFPLAATIRSKTGSAVICQASIVRVSKFPAIMLSSYDDLNSRYTLVVSLGMR